MIMTEQQDAEQKISQLQLLDQNLQNLLLQKQQVQAQQIEVENALEEVQKTTKEVYQIIGPVMVAVEHEKIKKELESRKEVLVLRMKSFEKQEAQLKEKASKVQAEVMQHLQQKKGGMKSDE